eukprot:Rmarinus@m.17367
MPWDRTIARDLPSIGATVCVDGDEKASGTLSSVLGNPIQSVLWLANFLSQQDGGRGLRSGDIISSGTCTGALPIAPLGGGEHAVQVRFEGLPQLMFRIAE